MSKESEVGCTREDGLLNAHKESEFCEVCKPAGANKAAEEGELSDEEIFAIYRELYGEAWDKGYEKPDTLELARKIIAADRASRQVANKAEVEIDECALAIYDISLILGLPRDATPVDVCRAVDRLATPPATTGASTVLTDERIKELWLAMNTSDYKDFARAIEREVAAQAGQVAVPEGFGQKVTQLVGEIRQPCSMAWRDNLVEQLIELIDPSPAKESK